MTRTLRSAAVTSVLAATALTGIPAAAADAAGDGPGITIICEQCQIAGGDIFNAGKDNIVGNGNGAGQLPGVGLPADSTLVEIVTDGSTYPGLLRVSQEGSAEYPERLYPAYFNLVRSDGASTAVYSSEGDRGHVTITVTEGEKQATCTSDGNLLCRLDPISPKEIRPLIISGR